MLCSCIGGYRKAGAGEEAFAPSFPRFVGHEEVVELTVAPAAADPEVAAADLIADRCEHGAFVPGPVEALVGLNERAHLLLEKPDGRVFRHLPLAALIEVVQHPDGLDELLAACGAGLKLQMPHERRRELSEVAEPLAHKRKDVAAPAGEPLLGLDQLSLKLLGWDRAQYSRAQVHVADVTAEHKACDSLEAL